MFSTNYHQIMNSNHILEKDISHYAHVQIRDPESYFNSLVNILQKCDQCGLKKETKFLIKKILDVFTLRNPFATPLHYEFASVNIFRLGIKFNQDPTFDKEMSIEKCQQLLSAEFKSDEFIEFEIKFYNDPEYSMNFTTPYDYLGLYQTAFPINDKQSERTIFFIDLALSIPELMFYSSKDIFFACLLLALKPNETEKAWILSQTFAPYKPLEASQIIYQIYEEYAK